MIKDYNLFITEEYKIDNISDYKLDAMSEYIDKIIEINKIDDKSDEHQDQWNDLIIKIIKFYKNILEKTYNDHGIDMTREMFYKIKDYLTKSDDYENATQVILFDLTSFVRNHIKK